MLFYVTNPHIFLKHRRRAKCDTKESLDFLIDNIFITFYNYEVRYIGNQICDMLDFLVDNIFITFGGAIFQQVSIPMGTNCAHFLANSFLYSYETEFFLNLVNNKKLEDTKSFNFAYKYIDDALSTNNPSFSKWLPSIYPPELEIKEITETAPSASFLDLHFEFDNIGHLSTKIYIKRNDLNFNMINCPYLYSNIPSSPAYGVYTSQLIRYDFLERQKYLRNRLLNQGYGAMRLNRSITKFFFF